MKKGLFLITLVLLGLTSKAQEKKVTVKLSGFVAAETYMDTRKNVAAREGAILLFPAPEALDAEGNDLNGQGGFFMTGIQSRLRATVSGFEAFGAKGAAVIEGDFCGTSEDKTGQFRLRHAFIKLDWQKDQLIAGKFWHPLFVTSAFPRVLHWGAGIPFGVLNRAPQLRYTRKLSTATSLSVTALSEMDFKSTGPDGASQKYAQQAGIPEMTLQVKTKLCKSVEAGFTAGYKTLKPLTVNTRGIKTDETLGSYYFNTWMGLSAPKFKWNLQGIYGQNMYQFVTMGGYGVKNVKDNGDYEYTNISTANITSDLFTTTGNVRYGLNLGYSKNLGAQDDLHKDDNGKFTGLYSRGSNIDYLYQVAPRVEFPCGKMKIGTEVIYTAAAYGTTQTNGKVGDTNMVGSTRFLLHLKYAF